ncbi:MAG: uroporphyrinogen decarboxylase family protein [Capsulimonadaceae bacterium]|nr:uroporphyrinogen decarboxylase family protein [Capsulimonadaceae bacterium]
MAFSAHDTTIIRQLAATYANVAANPIHARKADLWRRLNRLEPVRPLVWINEVPWHEIAKASDELTLRCEDPYGRSVESALRRVLYQWTHFPGDMILDPELYVNVVCSPVGVYADYGIAASEQRTGDSHGSASFQPVINDLTDVAKLRTPEVVVDWDETDRRFAIMSAACAGIVPVKIRGIVHQWMSPWDQMVHWYGIERLYTDMIDQPDLVHALLRRFMEAVHEVLDRQEEMGLLDAGNGNYRVGSGGLGITDQLPNRPFGSAPVSPRDQWGTSTGQIFCDVSPAMHDEFCLQYEQPYLERFGLSCYGCCEPLHHKMGILRKVKNLRRISISPWADLTVAAEQLQADYVFSFKPTPAVFASDDWNDEPARRNLQSLFEKAQGCRIEIIMKDISTVRDHPERIDQWETLAMQMATHYAEANGLDG